jgi:hypothetical protein
MHLFHKVPDINNLVLNNLDQKGCECEQTDIICSINPSLNEDSIVRLELEVFSDVVYNQGLAEVRPEPRQVFNIETVKWKSMLTVEAEVDQVLVLKEGERPVCVLLGSCSEDGDVIILRHQLQERVCSRTDGKLALVVVKL